MYLKGVNQQYLSDATGITAVTLSNYMRGKVTPNFYNVDKIAKALDCSIEEFRYTY
jgi:transcriptional regulator with XRE-family HTH domain